MLLSTTLSDCLAEPIAQRALLACLMIGFANGFVSAFVVLQKSALKIGTLSHALLPGIALAVLVAGLTQWSALAGAVFAALIVGLGSLFLSRTSRLDQDTAMGILYTTAFAGGLLILTKLDGSARGGVLVPAITVARVVDAAMELFATFPVDEVTVIDIAAKLVNARPDLKGKAKFDPSAIPLDDQTTYALLQSGETTGVFQLESSGMQQLFKDLRADCFEDIVAAVALYRPGPLASGMVGDFVNRKHGRAPIAKMHALVDHLLLPTYGVIVYQEQVMQIAQVLGGYSLGRADLLRRAMGKKSKEVMDKEKAGFVEGALGKGVDAKIADSVFELMAFFAGYGFNRSHSAAYGWVTYQTAYLKHHYPHEFMAGLMSCDADNIDNIVKFIAEARAMGLTVERPDVDESAADFTVTPRPGALGDKVIRFGLGAVKGVGSTAVDAVLDARKDGGGFTSIYDFGRRVDTQRCNRRVIEQLIKSGAFDGPIAGGRHRATILAALDGALEQGASEQRDRKSGQTSLFGLIAAPAPTPGAAAQGETYPAVEPWPAKQLLAFEKEALGFYISGHPLDRYRDDLARYATATTSDFIEGRRSAGEAAVGGVVVSNGVPSCFMYQSRTMSRP